MLLRILLYYQGEEEPPFDLNYVDASYILQDYSFLLPNFCSLKITNRKRKVHFCEKMFGDYRKK